MFNMNYICRICLIESSKVNEISQERDIIFKISLCFGKDIVINSLPQTICKSCIEKIEDTYTFRQYILKNQNILINRLKKEWKIVNHFDKDVIVIKEEIQRVNKENELISYHNIKVEENIINTNKEIGAGESEISEFEDTCNSDGEDNISLSLLKKSKEVGNEDDQHLQSNLRTVVTNEQTRNLETNANRCLTCFKDNSTQIDLLRHYNEVHKKNKLQGDNHPDTKDLIYEVVPAVDGYIEYRCKKCDKTFDKKRKLNKHIISHVQDRPFICKLCGRTYKTASELVRHGRAHSGPKIPCEYQCGYSTAYLGALKQHERRHRTEYAYTCDKCGKGFQVHTWYEQHQNIHTGIKPFVCDVCGVSFHMDRYLKAHVSSVHPKASDCKRFICVHCSRPYDSKRGLTLHLKEHGITSKFLCDTCGKVLSDARQLKLHKRMHQGDRPYSCSTCNKSFTKKFNLKLHARTHTGERAHACVSCGKRYTQRGTLLRHVQRFHNGRADVDSVGNET